MNLELSANISNIIILALFIGSSLCPFILWFFGASSVKGLTLKSTSMCSKSMTKTVLTVQNNFIELLIFTTDLPLILNDPRLPFY